MSSLAQKHNVGLDLSNKVAVVAGGTQGIGAAVSVRFATAGSSVYIIGRNAELGDAVVKHLKEVGHKDATYEFLKADLSLVSGVKDVVKQLRARTGTRGIDYIVQTQGGPPNGKFVLTSEGHESHFAVQCLSRFGIAYLLAKSGTLKESAVTICAPGGTSAAAPDVDDLELKKAKAEGRYGIMASGARDSSVMDAITARFAMEFPSLKAHHVFPGLVATSALGNQGFPYPLVLLSQLAMPIISRTIGNTASGYADIPVYVAANPQSRGQGLEFSNEKLKSVGKPKWIDEQPDLSKRLWDQLVEMFE
ncbi:hypothetical protein PLICRDRAFT_139249 [Plicaturopsis crispa FD-325 SS-3]|nr:hypothetical protein PLICRDRAFT_139249 [Plicaturopsis crispa FD-325 SS-3]